MKTFVESQFEVMEVYAFPKKASSYEDICRVSVWGYLVLRVSKKKNPDEDICWVSVWSYVGFCVSNKSELLSKRFLTLSLKLRKFMNFKTKRIFMKTFVEYHFEVI